jgi:hypothetical protein
VNITEETIILNMKAFSINGMYCRSITKTTAAYKVWRQGVLREMSLGANLEALSTIRNTFNPKIHRYCITITYYVPYNILFTKAGQMSARCFDVSNFEKPLLDILFDPKYHGKTPNLNSNDKYISDLTSLKRASDEYSIEVNIKLNALDSIK